MITIRKLAMAASYICSAAADVAISETLNYYSDIVKKVLGDL